MTYSISFRIIPVNLSKKRDLPVGIKYDTIRLLPAIMAIDYQQYVKHTQEYSTKFSQAYTVYMKALSSATSMYGSKLPAYTNEYQAAISRATSEYTKVLGDLKGKYADLSKAFWELK